MGCHYCVKNKKLYLSDGSSILIFKMRDGYPLQFDSIPVKTKFGDLRGVSCDKKGNIYIAGGHDGCVYKLNKSGKYLTKFNFRANTNKYKKSRSRIEINDCPGDVAVGKHIYCSSSEDYFSTSVQKFSKKGRFLRSLTPPLDKKHFQRPYAINLWNDRLFISDTFSSKILVYKSLLISELKLKKIGKNNFIRDFQILKNGNILCLTDAGVYLLSKRGVLLRKIHIFNKTLQVESISAIEDDYFVITILNQNIHFPQKSSKIIQAFNFKGQKTWGMEFCR